jgi:glyoxylase-like metal-dependent hydrolase (beta-lactamase superfamily II)
VATPIDVETLRGWLDTARPVTVLDVRGDDDRAQWTIPGSLHVDAYQDLKNGQPGPLATLALPQGRPVVTVCNAGGVSRTAADVLTRRGFDARSLTGGMNAWSLAWNVAEVPLAHPSARVVQVRRTGKGCLSYVIGSEGTAAVIDPSLPPEVYLGLGRARGWTIRYVLDTHVHADHLSRARQLAHETGAALLLPSQDRVRFPHSGMSDGDTLAVGRARLTAIRTPGHTPESTCYVLDDAAVFTGDTLFTKGVGRPDLHAHPDAARERARLLFASLSRLRALGSDLVVLPGHASDPIAFDGRPVAASMAEVAIWLAAWLQSESTFVDRVTSHLPPTPPNFARIVELNESGDLLAGDTTTLEAGANRCAIT